ncbi:MAG TPA: FUSC family membrane protein, partial [Bdellovibrio sp.]|nr:FUSC family membrane protein [Bdellovibrio sp.]
MAKADEFWAQLWIFEKNKMDPWVAFRAALGMALSLAIGYLLGSQATGLAIAIGALNVCYSDKSDAYRERGKRMLASALLSGVAIFVAAYSARDPLLMFLVLTAGTFFAGLLVVVDTVAAELGVIVLVSFLIFSTQPLNPEKSLMLSLSAIGGGLLQSFISIALWPLRRYQPERRALGTLYDDLASLAASKKYLSDTAPMGSSQSIATQEALHALASDNRQEARRYRSLLSQGERLRLTLLSLLR